MYPEPATLKTVLPKQVIFPADRSVASLRSIPKKIFLPLAILLFGSTCIHAQAITEIITDYNGYWKSGSTQINTVKPDNSHNLLSFTFNGTRYSTGVNDALLTAHGDVFIPGDFHALPVNTLSGTINSNTKIGLGAAYDGVINGASNPPPTNDIAYYLSDGSNGLDIGTCVANLPAGTLNFAVSNIKSSALGDGVPDIVITQVADPSSGSYDRYEFTDIDGNRIGNAVDIVLNTIAPVGNWTADFYEASSHPMTLQSGYTRTDRSLRLWAADFSAFGINSSNISGIAYFKITLNGNSDVAFVAYNHDAINIATPLATELSSFAAKKAGRKIRLSWQAPGVSASDRFLVQCSRDGKHFESIGSVAAGSNGPAPSLYTFMHSDPPEDILYYRLQVVSSDGGSFYSAVAQVDNRGEMSGLRLAPNPATTDLLVSYDAASAGEVLQLRNIAGISVMQKKLVPGSMQTTMDLRCLPAGLYTLVWSNGTKRRARPLLIR